MAAYRTHKKHVKFAKSRSPVPRKKVPSTADSYANIVLHYLSKLKSLFHSPDNSEKVMSSYYGKQSSDHVSKSILKKDPSKSDCSDTEHESKRKAYEIVNAALQYGCANNIIEKVGNYFLVKQKSDQKVSDRRPTPGPDYVRCASCNNLAKYSSTHQSIVRNEESKHSRRHRRRSKYEGDYVRRNAPAKRKRSSSSTSVVNYCPKCYTRMKSTKKYKLH